MYSTDDDDDAISFSSFAAAAERGGPESKNPCFFFSWNIIFFKSFKIGTKKKESKERPLIYPEFKNLKKDRICIKSLVKPLSCTFLSFVLTNLHIIIKKAAICLFHDLSLKFSIWFILSPCVFLYVLFAIIYSSLGLGLYSLCR